MSTNDLQASSDLLFCPFCGGEAKAFYDEAGGVYEVQCQECGAEPYIGSRRGAPGMRTLGDVMKAWNRRAERTCHYVYDREICAWRCSECGGLEPVGDHVRYCPDCGARIAEEVSE